MKIYKLCHLIVIFKNLNKNLMRPTKRQKLQQKRERHKALFNQLYEAAGGGPEATAFYEKLEKSREVQQQLNLEVLKNLPEDVANQLEGFAPGVYVRIELKGRYLNFKFIYLCSYKYSHYSN